jgi:hypothetical protein
MAGQIIKRGDKTWMVRIFMGRDGKGKRRYLNKTLRGTKKKAQTYLSKTLTEISAGTFVEASPLTVEEYLKKWLEAAARPRLRENTYREYEGLIERYVKPALGDGFLADLRSLDVQAFYAGLSDRKLSPRTVRYTHSVLTSAFKQAVRWRMLARNPCEAVELPRKTATEMKCLTPGDAANFWRRLLVIDGTRFSLWRWRRVCGLPSIWV